MKGYKGFGPGLVCLGKQYAENTVFEEDDAKICQKGMHFCERPLDVLQYYPPCDENGNLNEFCEVEALGESHTDDDVKYCTKKLKIGAKIGIVGLVNAEVEYIKEQINRTPKKLKSVNSGYRSSAVNSGDSSSAVNSGYRSSAVNSGDRSSAVNSGYSSSAVNSGDRSSAVNSGYSSSAVNSGKEGVAISLGIDSKAKAELGGWIVVCEWEYKDDGEYHRIGLRAAQVDGETIKADTWYKLVDGEFVEQQEVL